ncbi:MAG: YbdD/YjiX family protein [Gemmatimonadales bacterium]
MSARADRRTGGPAGGALRRILRSVRRVCGMPDYRAYVEHLRRRHPGQPVPTEREYYDEYLAHRYGDGSSRCC